MRCYQLNARVLRRYVLWFSALCTVMTCCLPVRAASGLKCTESSPVLRPADWSVLPGWHNDQFDRVLPALQRSCSVLQTQAEWRTFCRRIHARLSPKQLKKLLERHLKPYQIIAADGGSQGMITGYYEPLLQGSRHRTEVYRYPIYRTPDDLIILDPPMPLLDNAEPISRARFEDGDFKPYYTRGELMHSAVLEPYVLCWVKDEIALFFLHIQGSGRIQFEDGSVLRVGFDNHNGHPYRSIGQVLIARGEMRASEASMQRIQAWAQTHPEQVSALLAENPRFIFFRALTNIDPDQGPIGAAGVALTPQRSIAVDSRYATAGLPMFLSTTMPNSTMPMNRLVFAQDTGSAIVGPVRADFFWGYGDHAGMIAGRMKQQGQLWVLLPQTLHWRCLPEQER